MNKVNKYSKIIANYLYNDMSQEERKQFEKDLLVNEELSSEYELQASAIKYLKARITLEEMESDPDLAAAEKLAEEILDEEIESSNVSFSDNRRSVFSDRKSLIRILAAAVVLIGIVSTTLIITSNSNQSLYKSFYDPFDETYLTYRGDNDVLKASIANGIKVYTDKNYKESYELFQEVQLSYPDNNISKFYLGLSLMGIGEIEEATMQFELYLGSFESYQPEVKWYLGLCYLRTDRINEAYKMFQDLSAYPGKYGENSRKLVRKLERKLER